MVFEPIISKGAMPKIKSRKVVAQPTHAHELAQKPTITHEEKKIAVILFLTGGFAMWFSQLYGLCFDEWAIMILQIYIRFCIPQYTFFHQSSQMVHAHVVYGMGQELLF